MEFPNGTIEGDELDVDESQQDSKSVLHSGVLFAQTDDLHDLVIKQFRLEELSNIVQHYYSVSVE